MCNLKKVLAWAKVNKNYQLIKMRPEVMVDATKATVIVYRPSKHGTFYLTAVDMTKWRTITNEDVTVNINREGDTMHVISDPWVELDKETGKMLKEFFDKYGYQYRLNDMFGSYRYLATIKNGLSCVCRAPTRYVPIELHPFLEDLLVKYYGYRCIGSDLNNMNQLSDDDVWATLKPVK